MQKLIWTKICVLLLSLLFVEKGMVAQSDAKAIIYNISFFADQELTTSHGVSTDNRNFLNGVSVSDDFPDSLKEVLMNYTEQKISEQFNEPVETMRPSKKAIQPSPGPGYVIGLPYNMLNKALKLEKKYEKYYDVRFMVYPSGGYSIGLPDGTYSKIKPRVEMVITAYNQKKEKVWKQSTVLKDFSKLRQKEKNTILPGVKIKKSETLSPDELYAMYIMALEDIFNKGK